MNHTILSALMERLDYPEAGAQLLCGELEQLDSSLKDLLQRWLDTGIDSDATLYSGYSIDRLRQEQDMNFIAALLTLNWIVKDPRQALPMIKQGIM